MALADPQSIKVGGSATSLPRVSTGTYQSEYLSEDGKYKLTLSTQQSSASRKRQLLRVDLTEITADPFIPSQNTENSMSAYVVIDRPPAGFSNAKALEVLSGLIELGSKETNKVFSALLSSQS
jgi:hypothetical protein